MTRAAKENMREESPAGCLTNYTRRAVSAQILSMLSIRTFSLFSKVSKTRPGSGNMCPGRGWICCTLREYGVPDLPMSGTQTLLYDPSAVLN